MLFFENMYSIIIIIIKNVWLTTVVKDSKRVWTFPLLVYVVLLHYLFLLCKMTTRPIWLGTRGETGVDAGPALLSLVRVSAGWCSFLSPASQTGRKPEFMGGGLHLTKGTTVLNSGKKKKKRLVAVLSKLIFGQKRTWSHCEIMLRAGERHTDRMAWVHFDLWSCPVPGVDGCASGLVWSLLPAAPNSPPFRVSLCPLYFLDLHVW